MPSKSAKQARTMAAAAHDPAFARKMGIPQSVAREFNSADMEVGVQQHNKRPMKSRHNQMEAVDAQEE